MKRHEITLDDAIEALDSELPIASASSAVKKARKVITFNPSSLKYTVSYRNRNDGIENLNEYIDPLIAIEMYNNYNV